MPVSASAAISGAAAITGIAIGAMVVGDIYPNVDFPMPPVSGSTASVSSSPVPSTPSTPAPSTTAINDESPFQRGIQGNPYWQTKLLDLSTKSKNKNKSGREALSYLASNPVAHWIGPWYKNKEAIQKDVREVSARSIINGRKPLYVVYGLGGCAGKTKGYLSGAAYTKWVNEVAVILKDTRAAVIIEPDALALNSNTCKNTALLTQTIKTLSPGLDLYLDAGHPHWHNVDETVKRVNQVGKSKLTGLSFNVSNVVPTKEVEAYAEKVSAKLGGIHYVIDTSRNGGITKQYCNPTNDVLGEAPRSWQSGDPTHLDALLWVKAPGEGDGDCNNTGKPARLSGQFYEQDAVRKVLAAWKKDSASTTAKRNQETAKRLNADALVSRRATASIAEDPTLETLNESIWGSIEQQRLQNESYYSRKYESSSSRRNPYHGSSFARSFRVR